MTNKTEMVSVPREWLNRVSLLQISLDELQDQAAELLAAPTEDVRAVLDEPVAFHWRRKTVVEGSQWSRWVDCTAEDYNAIVASPGPGDRGIIREGRKLYRHPQRPVVPLDPVEGDVLPPVGSTVQIQLGDSGWFDHTVTGYYVWPNHGLDKNVHRVFVRVKDSSGTPNARLLADIRLPTASAQQ